MNEYTSLPQKIKIADLTPFSLCISQPYEDKILKKLMNGIERDGLQNPIIVRPATDGKYEIICGYNRARAMRELGHDEVSAEVREALSDDEAIELYYEDNLSKDSFRNRNYMQKIDIVRYAEKIMKGNSRQGRRTDLEEKKSDTANNGRDETVRRHQSTDQMSSAVDTSSESSIIPIADVRHKLSATIVESTPILDTSSDEDEKNTSIVRHKLKRKSRRSTTRDMMASRLGISTATFSKYRSIAKCPDDVVEPIVRLLDGKHITFEIAYVMSGLRMFDVETLVQFMNDLPDMKIDAAKLKSLRDRGKRENWEKGILVPRSKDHVREVLVPKYQISISDIGIK